MLTPRPPAQRMADWVLTRSYATRVINFESKNKPSKNSEDITASNLTPSRQTKLAHSTMPNPRQQIELHEVITEF